jgi:polyisoprenoid-binding protein YceI
VTTSPESSVTKWKIDPAHSSAEFQIKHMMISNVKGAFSGISGTLELDESDISRSHVTASIETASINTRNEDRDKHLKSAEFFDVEQFPAMTFQSTRVLKKDEGELAVTGDLTLHGITRSVVFEVDGPSAPSKDPWGNMRIGLSATTRTNRKDFGLTWNAALESGGVLVDDKVAITLDLQFLKA